MSKDNVKTYSIEEDKHSGLELELQFMPRFFLDSCGNPMQPHTHEFYQIIWFRRGHGTHMVDFVDYPVTDNTIFFIAPGQIHAFDHNTDYNGVVIHFNASFMADEDSSESVFIKYNVFNAYDSLPFCKITADEELRLLNIVREMNHKDYMQYLLRLFLIRVQRSGERKEMPKLYVTSVANRTFVRFRQLLEQNYCNVHTVQEYADLLNVSARTLTKYVQQSAHRSPLQIINDRIVLEAKRQLQNSMMSVKEIGYQLGFEDPSYFVKFFKRMTGKMPTELRKKTYAPLGSKTNSTESNTNEENNSKNKLYMKQRIAIPTADGTLFPHFGKAPQVTVFDIEDNKIADKQVFTSPEHAHGAMPRFLQGLDVTDVICGGLGAGAVKLLSEMDIKIHGGAPAIAVDEVLKKYLDGTIVYGDSSCHHDACDGHHHE